MYLGALFASSGAGIAVAGISSFALGQPWWFSLILWSLTGTIVILSWVLYGVTHEDRLSGVRALSECDDEPGVAEHTARPAARATI